MSARIECWECGESRGEGPVVVWDICDKCKSRLDPVPQSPEPEPMFQVKNVERTIIGDTVMYDITFEFFGSDFKSRYFKKELIK
jgi:hypothetical protein